MLEIIFASKNPGKIREIKDILKDLKVKILTLNDFLYLPEVKEDGRTFRENALKKAEFFSNFTGKICLADDSGLEIEYLKGKPGIFSSRWGNNDRERIQKILNLLKDVPEDQRKAKFVCVLVLFFPDGRRYIVEGECQGIITNCPRGNSGFGYDPIFLVPEYKKTFAELGEEIKNKISHRAKALNQMIKIIHNLLVNE